jgi:predicted Zn-dependent protease
MAAAGSAVPEFFSDHPSDATRIAQIKKEMPEALKYYKGKSSTSAPKTIKIKSSKKRR